MGALKAILSSGSQGSRGTVVEERSPWEIWSIPNNVPLVLWNQKGLHFGVGGLQTHVIMLLEETLERRTSAYPRLHMRGNDNVAILARVLRCNDHIVPITDVIVDHRLSTYNQRKNIRSLKALIHLKERSRIGKNVERRARCDRSFDRNAMW